MACTYVTRDVNVVPKSTLESFMKKISAILITFASLSAFACPTGEICRDSKVIPEDYIKGHAIVKAVNASSQVATVLGNYSSNYHRYSVNQLALTSGCLGRVCAGDRIIPDAYSKGDAQVEGINTYSNKLTVLGNYSSNYDRYEEREIAKKSGCLMGICVGDKVFPDEYSKGYANVVGINIHKKTFTVLGNYSSKYDRYRFDSLALVEECLEYDSSARQLDF